MLASGNGAGAITSAPAGINCPGACAGNFTAGTIVTLTATASMGSTFSGWSGGGCTGTGTCVVTVNAATTVTATFSLEPFILTVQKSGNGVGTVTSSPAGITCGSTCSSIFNFGTMVTLTTSAATGSTFTGWSGGGCTGTGACTTTIMAATTVTAQFTLNRHAVTVAKVGTGAGTVTSTPAGINCGATCTADFDYGSMVVLTATPSMGSTFSGWTGGGCSGTGTCTVTATAAAMVSAIFTLDQVLLTVNRAGNGTGTVTSAPAGISCGASCSAIFPYGTMVTLTAAAGAGSTFTGWSGGGGCSGTGTCVTTLTAATTVTASFALDQHVLTVTKAGNGSGTVASSPGGILCGTDCSKDYASGTMVTLSASASNGSSFSGWSGACSGSGTCAVTMTAARSVTATFTLDRHAITVTRSGTGSGTVTSVPAGINCGADCTELYDFGTVVTLTATPATGSTFSGWLGGGCGGTGTCTVPVSAAATVDAAFTVNSYTLSASRAGTGTGTISSSPAGINCGLDCSESYNHGTVVTLTATPSASSTFVGWSGDCTGTGQCVITMTGASNVRAMFSLNSYPLTVARAGNSTGTVTSAPVGINCGADCSENYDHGTIVTLTATPAANTVFAGWSGSCTGTGTCQVTLTAAATVTATFSLASRTLSVTKAGSGLGTVTSSPAGINCGLTCAAAYNHGSAVVLTAVPNAGSAFTGWTGGGCSGVGTCTVTLTADTIVTATFSPLFTLSVALAGSGTGSVTSSPAGINCAPDCTEPYISDTSVTLTATPGSTSTFTGWSGSGCSGTGTCTVSMTQARSVSAVFTPISLTVQRVGVGTGTVTSVPAGINCGADCSEIYARGTLVTLTATPSAPDVFAGWSGGGCSGVGGCTVTMNAATTVTATFMQAPNYMFLTSMQGSGNLGGLQSADNLCQMSAMAANLPGTYRAWLSAPGINAITRLGTASGWVRTDGMPVFSSANDLTAGRVMYLPNRDAFGADVGLQRPMTGTNANGTETPNTCNGWTSALVQMAVGHTQLSNGQWTQTNNFNCSAGGRFYCMGIDRQGSALPAPIANVRRAFVSDGTFNPATGLAAADSLCQGEATSAGLTGAYRAFLATANASAASRFSVNGLTWARVDDVPLAPTAMAVMSTPLWNTGLNRTASGGLMIPNTQVWTGANNPTTPGTFASTCSNWGPGGTNGIAGLAEAALVQNAFSSSPNWSCGFANMRVYCLQE